jgi:hypothetical protein
MTSGTPTVPSCWICGADANSAEHMVKASDVRAHFPGLNQKTPAYRQSSKRKNEPIRGAKAPILKFRPSLCAHCNNARSQPWDKAWAALERGVRESRPALRTGDRIPLEHIFPNARYSSMLGVHQYFTKLLGCYSVEYDVPLPVSSFAHHLLQGSAEPGLRLVFVHVPQGSMNAKIQVGHVQSWTGDQSGRSLAAVWHYIVGTLGVAISYTAPGYAALRFTSKHGWHPDDVSRTWRLY